MSTFSFVPTTLEFLGAYKRQALRENAALWEGKTPITWFGGYMDDVFVGCIGLLEIGGRARVRGWYVLPEYRRKGYGRSLLTEIIDYARSLGYEVIEMTTPQWQAAIDHGWQVSRDYPNVKTVWTRIDD